MGLHVSSEQVAHLSVVQLVDKFRRQELSPVEAAKAALDQISRHDGEINAFVVVTEDRALAAARESERRWRKGEPLGPFDGVPLSVKDIFMVAGLPFRRGSLTTPTEPVSENAPIFDRVLEGGACLIGLTTTPEFGAGPVTISPLTGITRNPWDASKSSGGSSGGAAAAVAAGMGQVALASDAGGSARIPAALCGVVGFKGTGGRVPSYPTSPAGALAVPGPITRTVGDVAIMLDALARPDLRDVETLPFPADFSYCAQLGQLNPKSLRIAFTTTLNYAPQVDAEVAEAVRKAASLFADLGAVVEEAHPEVENPVEAFTTIFYGGISYTLRNISAENFERLSPQVRDAVKKGRSLSLIDFMAAHDQRRAFARKMEAFFSNYDLLLMPTVATTAFDAERYIPREFEHLGNPRAWTPFAYAMNLSQQPALSVPCQSSRSGLPIGLQIVGPRFSDLRVLQAGHLFEQLRRPLPTWPKSQA